MRLILASSSPRRQQLLAEAGLEFEVVRPLLDEPASLGERLAPAQRAEALAYFKARAVAEGQSADACVLGADTVVAGPGRVFGKAADPDEARRMLCELAGTRHAVITGVAAVMGRRRLIASTVTYVTMWPITRQEVEQYVASGEWVGKAGAYAIQETADRFVEKIEGSYSNVVGLPLELVRRMIASLSPGDGKTAAPHGRAGGAG